MSNLRKIAKVLMLAAFFCTFSTMAKNASAACMIGQIECKGTLATNCCASGQVCNNLLGTCEAKKDEQKSQAGGGCVVFTDCASGMSCVNSKCVAPTKDGGCQTASDCAKGTHCDMNTKKCVADETKPAVTNTNPKQDAGTGGYSSCKSAGAGIFSGLVQKGCEIFMGLRDLIYVVAGFGIIGVAVGGFFGNLNWKWLGAIIIGLVVIATTGEIINAIAGSNIGTTMISDTLK